MPTAPSATLLSLVGRAQSGIEESIEARHQRSVDKVQVTAFPVAGDSALPPSSAQTMSQKPEFLYSQYSDLLFIAEGRSCVICTARKTATDEKVCLRFTIPSHVLLSTDGGEELKQTKRTLIERTLSEFSVHYAVQQNPSIVAVGNHWVQKLDEELIEQLKKSELVGYNYFAYGSPLTDDMVVFVQELENMDGSLKKLHDILPDECIYESDKWLAWAMLSDVLEGLAHLHSYGVLHRDIKPANILWVRKQTESHGLFFFNPRNIGASLRMQEEHNRLIKFKITDLGSFTLTATGIPLMQSETGDNVDDLSSEELTVKKKSIRNTLSDPFRRFTKRLSKNKKWDEDEIDADGQDSPGALKDEVVRTHNNSAFDDDIRYTIGLFYYMVYPGVKFSDTKPEMLSQLREALKKNPTVKIGAGRDTRVCNREYERLTIWLVLDFPLKELPRDLRRTLKSIVGNDKVSKLKNLSVKTRLASADEIKRLVNKIYEEHLLAENAARRVSDTASARWLFNTNGSAAAKTAEDVEVDNLLEFFEVDY